ncbi:MAG: hypothetical protein E6H07_15885 [Bacteroidetes bacterium]|nr:MAG: hypothetical protein E6H07_15885 [Bacteroidota bacterium]
MKANRFSTLAKGLVLASLIIYSCKKTDLGTNDSADAFGIVPSINATQEITTSQRLMDCSSDCINPAGPFVERSAMCSSSWGGPNSDFHTKTVTYVAYNTATDLVVKVTYVKSGKNTNASDLVSATVNGVVRSVPTLASGATAEFTFPLPTGWKKCDVLSIGIHQEGQNSPINMNCWYSLFEICAARCATTFEGDAISCGTEREAIYTLTAESDMSYIKMQGGLTNFTGANADIEFLEGGENLTYSQSTPGGSSNRIIKIQGSMSACERVRIRIRWNSTNTGGVITGSWSVKDANGVEIAPSVAGLTCE